MAIESTLTTLTQTAGLLAVTTLPTTTTLENNDGEISISIPGVITTATSTTTTALAEPISSNAAINPSYATVKEVNTAELYLESLSDDELAQLCERTNIIIGRKEQEIPVKKL